MIQKKPDQIAESSKQNTIRRFFIDGRSVCPFAKTSAAKDEITFAEINEGEDPQIAILPAMEEFSKGARRVLIVIAPNDAPEHSVGYKQAVEIFIELCVAEDRRVNEPAASSADITLLRKHWTDVQLPHFDLFSNVNPRILVDGKLLFVTAMGPAYEAKHSRYAPHNIIVITWASDVNHIQTHRDDIVKKIRARMLEAVGRVYDADELYMCK